MIFFTAKSHYYFLFFIVYSVLIIVAEAQQLLCPQNQIRFEKLIGIRPDLLQKGNLLYSNRNNVPITIDCISKCASDTRCMSFLLNYNTSECYSYSNATIRTERYDYDSRPNTNVVWFRKACLNVPEFCKTKSWTMEIVAGATLIGYNTKRINNRVTRQECIKFCIEERSFNCKSIKFSLVTKYLDTSDANPLGNCILSSTDRHLTPHGYRVSKYEDEYIENQCINSTDASEYCAYEEYENSYLEHLDLLVNNISQTDCKHLCDISVSFNCRGYSTVPLINYNLITKQQNFNCLLHSEDSKLIGPKLLKYQNGATYYEKARCLNVSVLCTGNSMQIVYQPEQPFSGKIYTTGFSDTLPCFANGRKLETLKLNIPLNGNNSLCGITEAYTAEPWNRTLKSVVLVIQYNALIVTQADRLIKIGCVYGNDKDSDQEITLDTSVNFTSNYPNRGSTVVNASTIYPNVTMRILDYITQKPVTDTEIGQELELIIEITPGNGPYDIWAGNLIATSGNNTVQLLDESGCPTYLNIFSKFNNIQTNTSRKLISTFQAFKFPSSPVVRFSVMVHFCVMKCPPVECMNEENQMRYKRNTDPKLINDEVNATVSKINSKKNTDNDTTEMVDQMPLNVVLLVRGVNIVPDQLVYGENNRILVAGYDYITNEVCVDYNLFIGLLVMWVILQVIIVVCCFFLIRKYKKYFHIAYTRQLDDMHQNFGFGSRDLNRRVHWADE